MFNVIFCIVYSIWFTVNRLITSVKEDIDVLFAIWNFFLQKCLLSSLLRFVRLLSTSLILIGCRAAKRVNFRKNVLKIFFSETIRGEAETWHTCLGH